MSSGNDRLETTMVVFPAVCGGILILLLMSFCKKCGFTDTYDINANKYFEYVLYVCIKFCFYNAFRNSGMSINVDDIYNASWLENV